LLVPEVLSAAIETVFDSLFCEIKGLTAAIVSTDDGHGLAMRGATSLSTSKLGAMTSSISALASAISRESRTGNVQSIIIEADDGYLLVVAIPNLCWPLTLCVLTTRSAILGQIAYTTKRCSAYLVQVA
jgi:predicted regulator of Ras-like GTPase activity (Roadblock/LC7/MglB family)